MNWTVPSVDVSDVPQPSTAVHNFTEASLGVTSIEIDPSSVAEMSATLVVTPGSVLSPVCSPGRPLKLVLSSSAREMVTLQVPCSVIGIV